jgi:hypothetical protein
VARIIDKNTRLIDVDFERLTVSASRLAGEFDPVNTSDVTYGLRGTGQLLNRTGGGAGAGSFIQYVRLDLSFMTKNNEIMLPTEVSVQRTSPVPTGFNNNGNNFDQIEEYIFILSRPLNNTEIAQFTSLLPYEQLRDLGLDGSCPTDSIVGELLSGNAGWPTQAQTIYAEKRMYSYNESLGATQRNGQLIQATVGDIAGGAVGGGAGPPIPAVNNPYNTLMGMPTLDSVISWGSMAGITGPNLHCYRMVINRNQTFPAIGTGIFTNVDLTGTSSCTWPPVSVRFLCTDPDYSEGEYLTRIANAMNNTAEGGPVA